MQPFPHDDDFTRQFSSESYQYAFIHVIIKHWRRQSRYRKRNEHHSTVLELQLNFCPALDLQYAIFLLEHHGNLIHILPQGRKEGLPFLFRLKYLYQQYLSLLRERCWKCRYLVTKMARLPELHQQKILPG